MKSYPEDVLHQKADASVRLHGLFIGSLLVVWVMLALGLFGSLNAVWERPWGFWGGVFSAKALIEIVASVYALFYLMVALHYRTPSCPFVSATPPKIRADTVIAYFCCDDLDSDALESIVVCSRAERLAIYVHDDSATTVAQATVNAVINKLRTRYGCDIRVLRRAERSGGKPGAVNHLLQQLPPETEYLVLCDSDSFFLQSDFVRRSLRFFKDQRVALVQWRNIGHISPQDTDGYKLLSQAVNFYDIFVYFMDRYGWSPFLGHNAVLRVSAVNTVGGFTSGQLADDIDLSIKLRLHGYTIRYMRDVIGGERHPLTYEALRRRTAKWAYGCTQTLLRWGWAIFTSRRLTIQDKITFFLTVGYYHFQILLLFYLLLFYVVLPFSDPGMGGLHNLLVSAGLILLLTFVPSLAYFVADGNLRKWPWTALCWGLTYGSQDLVIVRAVLQCLRKKKLSWTPTNAGCEKIRVIHLWPELCLGSGIVGIALIQFPTLLYLPTTILFAGKFLIAPVLNRWMFKRFL